jgi:hypothetical protein
MGGATGKLGDWVSRQRAQKNRLSPHRRNLLGNHLPSVLDPREKLTWEQGLGMIQQFRIEHGRLPRQIGPGVPECEGRMGNWLRDQRYRFHALTPESQGVRSAEALKHGIILGDPTRKGPSMERTWAENLEQYTKFIENNGRRPAASSSEEKFLADWGRSNQRKYRAGTMRPDRAELFSAVCPDLTPGRWFVGKARDEAWHEHLSRCISFHELQGRPPMNTSTATDELKLREWTTRQRQSWSAGTLSGERKDIILESAPWILEGYDDARQSYFEKLSRNRPSIPAAPESSASWWARLAEYLSFMDANDRLPSAKAEDPLERRHASWLNVSIRNARAGLRDPARRTVLEGWHPNLLN